jgi:hypothetical protein
MSDGEGEVWLRPSRIGAAALAIPTAPDCRACPGLYVLPPDHQGGGHGRRKILTRCRIGAPPFVEEVEGVHRGHPGKGGDMTEYLIAFNGEWVPDHTVEDLREKSKAVKALVAEMKAAGVFIFTGGLDDAAPVFSVDASSGTPLFTDGPFIESKEHLGGFAVVDVADEEAARLWAGKIAVACGWPQEVRRFRVPMQLPETS